MPTRYKYRCSLEENRKMVSPRLLSNLEVRSPDKSDVAELAKLMLDSYHGTIDFGGETIREATKEVKSYFERTDSIQMLSCSFVALSENRIISACLISKWEKRPAPLISYIMTRSSFKGKGLGKALVHKSLQCIKGAGHQGVVAVVTDGNTPSERLMASLGFRRVQ